MFDADVTAELDRQMVEIALRSTEKERVSAAAEQLRVSESTVRRWRSGDISLPLREPTRAALINYLVSFSEDELGTDLKRAITHGFALRVEQRVARDIEFAKRFGKRLREIRESRGLSREELAEAWRSVDARDLGLIEEGQHLAIFLDDLTQLAEALGVTVGFLLSEEDPVLTRCFPDVSFLGPGARSEYERRVGSYAGRGWKVGDVLTAANALIYMLHGEVSIRDRHGNQVPLTDEVQSQIIRGAGDLVELMYETPSLAHSTSSTLPGQWREAVQKSDRAKVPFHLDSVMVTPDSPGQVLTYSEGQWTCDCEEFRERGECPHAVSVRSALAQSEERDAEKVRDLFS